MLAAALDTELIRLQCYEGLDVHHAVYEWNYARQLLEIRLLEATHARRSRRGAPPGALQRAVPDQAAAAAGARAARRDGRRCCSSTRSIAPTRSSRASCWSCCPTSRSRFPSSAPSRAAEPPVVVLTSNRTREVHDALKRRCLYQWIDYPDFERSWRIVARAVPQASAALAAQVTAFVQELRTRRAVQDAGRVRDARLGRGAGGARPRGAGRGGDRATRSASCSSTQRGRRGDARRAALGGAVARDAARRAAHLRAGDQMSALAVNLLAFGRLLRALGLDVSAAQSRDALAAVAAVGVGRARRRPPGAAGHAGQPGRRPGDLRRRVRRLLARSRRRWAVATCARWASRTARRRCRCDVALPESDAGRDGDAAEADAEPRDLPAGELQTWSDAETLRDQGLRRHHRRGARTRCGPRCRPWRGRPANAARGAGRQDRRPSTCAGPGAQPAQRRAPAAADPRRRRPAPRPLVLLADVSGSMERYSRMLLHFVYALAAGPRRRRGVPVLDRASRASPASWPAASIDAAVTAVVAAGARLVGRHPHRRGAADVQLAGRARVLGPAPGRAGDVGRVGPRRSRRAAAARWRACSAAATG